ncbi:hypothetical protein [uncultured Shewanella sp.]|uniref:hypothetical protein n=1 Tax=uncultured Shewanella sp. TaxID=173975 RepID=UPI002611448F|nr:hypothetical protein [uncultured Shewanella sp.]
MTTKNVALAIGASLILLLNYWLFFDDENETTSSPKIERKKPSPSLSHEQEKTSVRLVQAVTYEDAYAAASIMKRAMDTTEAKDFVIARTSLRVLRIEDDYFNLLEKIELSKAKIEKIKQDGAEIPIGNILSTGNSAFSSITSPNSANINANGNTGKRVTTLRQPEDNRVRLIGITENSTITVKIGSEEYTHIRVGHVINQQYKVQAIDVTLECVELNEILRKKVTTICYQG